MRFFITEISCFLLEKEEGTKEGAEVATKTVEVKFSRVPHQKGKLVTFK